MSAQQLFHEAEQCRVRARAAAKPERDLLLKMAASFEDIASTAEARRAIEETRCW